MTRNKWCTAVCCSRWIEAPANTSTDTPVCSARNARSSSAFGEARVGRATYNSVRLHVESNTASQGDANFSPKRCRNVGNCSAVTAMDSRSATGAVRWLIPRRRTRISPALPR